MVLKLVLNIMKAGRFTILFLITLAFAIGCGSYSRKEVDRLLESDRPGDLIKAYYLIGEQKDTLYIPTILRNANDPRITHDLEFKGNSVYQHKMIALKKISGLTPPTKITYKPDSLVIQFYRKWATTHSAGSHYK